MRPESAIVSHRDHALIYVRVSRLDDDERERKISPDMQREKALALRQVQTLKTQVFEDLDLSGKSTANRPQYQALMQRLAAADVRYVVAYDLSRVTRSMGDQNDFFDALTASGAMFLESSTGRVIDPKDEDEELSANVLGSVNQHARKKTARRVRDSLATKVARGDLVGPVPAGYVRRKKVLDSGKVAKNWIEPDPDTAPTIRRIFREYSTGAYSLKALAAFLNQEGIKPPRSPNLRNNRPAATRFTADVLKDIIANPRYVGQIPRRDGTIHHANYEPLIDEDTWAACQRAKLSHRRVRPSRRGRRSPYLLSGVLRCFKCGSSMSGQTWKPDRSHPQPRACYTCYLRRTGGSPDCDQPYVSQELLETDLLTILRVVALPEGLAEEVDKALAAAYTEDPAQSRYSTLAGIDSRLGRLADLYELNDISREEYLARREALQNERKTTETSRPQPVFARQRTMLTTLVDDWEHLIPQERKALVAEVFEEITASERGIEDFLPKEQWKRYMRAVVPNEAERVPTERKTGLEPATLTLAR